jgi:hypothetical protein
MLYTVSKQLVEACVVLVGRGMCCMEERLVVALVWVPRYRKSTTTEQVQSNLSGGAGNRTELSENICCCFEFETLITLNPNPKP